VCGLRGGRQAAFGGSLLAALVTAATPPAGDGRQRPRRRRISTSKESPMTNPSDRSTVSGERV